MTRPGGALLDVTAFFTEPGIKIPGYVNQAPSELILALMG